MNSPSRISTEGIDAPGKVTSISLYAVTIRVAQRLGRKASQNSASIANHKATCPTEGGLIVVKPRAMSGLPLANSATKVTPIASGSASIAATVRAVIGNIPPAEAEEQYYAVADTVNMAA